MKPTPLNIYIYIYIPHTYALHERRPPAAVSGPELPGRGSLGRGAAVGGPGACKVHVCGMYMCMNIQCAYVCWENLLLCFVTFVATCCCNVASLFYSLLFSTICNIVFSLSLSLSIYIYILYIFCYCWFSFIVISLYVFTFAVSVAFLNSFTLP